MTEVYLVYYTVEAEIHGQNTTLGVFDDEPSAHQHIQKLLQEQNCKYETRGEYYVGSNTIGDNHYCFRIDILKSKMNQLKTPFFMKK